MSSEKILEKKRAIAADIAGRISSSCVGILVDYKGINVGDDTKLRKELRDSGVNYSVIKNTMLVRAFEQAGIRGLDGFLKGSTAMATSESDYVSAAKILCKFQKEKGDFFTIKVGFIENEVVDKSSVERLAELPSREILIATVLGGLNSPIVGFVGVLNGVLRSLVIVIGAVEKKCSEKS
ncbi:MAG: 50S ribosomal protein L10 [Oscillospiraceae bacterium]|jgi:large subunit ribosomal protein L10|nr:50S ribosomal protein L10 [Oscillospiraceae bacterium]